MQMSYYILLLIRHLSHTDKMGAYLVMAAYTRVIHSSQVPLKVTKLYLQFVAYYKDVEISNPLGSCRGKHKLGKYI